MNSTRPTVTVISETSSGVSDPERERVLKLIDYLIKIAEHRTPIIRNVEKYDNILWLSDIPQLRGCYTQVWGAEEGREQDQWIEIQSHTEPALPKVPRICEEWVDYATLRNKQDLPQLRESIAKEMPNPNWTLDSEFLSQVIEQKINLVDEPHVQSAWDNYVEKYWVNWMERHDKWESIHKPYSKLFQMHQQQLRSREDYELVLAFGLLTWKTTTNHQIRRHLIVADVELTFESQLAKFSVRPIESGADFRLELDMIDIDSQPVEAGSNAKSSLSEIEIQIGDRSPIEGILTAVANSINPRSQYKDSLEPMTPRWTDQPIVEYAPALVLRRRSTRGLTETLRSIRESVEAGGTVPSNFGDLAEVAKQHEDKIGQESDLTFKSDGRVYFPLLANDEQRRIVDRLNKQKCVLVQGPPGTGKSQTIVNLICHLLATGRRILITAKTPRALDVIERLMPQQLRALCISRLGQGSEEQRSIERSVKGILRKNQEWDDDDMREKIDRIEAKYDSKKRNLARVSRKQRKLRKSETRSYTLVEEKYEGTPARIAEIWSNERSMYGWLRDIAELGTSCDFSSQQLCHLLTELRHFSPGLRLELQLYLPTSLPSTEEFTKLIQSERDARRQEQHALQTANLKLSLDIQETSELQVIDTIRQRLEEYLKAYQMVVRDLRLSGSKWLRDVLHSVASDDYADWQDLYTSTTRALVTIDELLEVVGNLNVGIPATVDVADALELSTNMEQHLEGGGRLGWWIFAPRIAIRCRRKFKRIRIDGSRCDTRLRLSQLHQALKLRAHLTKVCDRWIGIAELPIENQLSLITELRSLSSKLKNALLGKSVEDVIEAVHKCRVMDQKYRVMDKPIWTDELRIGTLIASCELAASRLKIEEVSEQLDALEESVMGSKNPHQIVSKLCKSIRDRNISQYEQHKSEVLRLVNERKRLAIVDEEFARLQECLPRLAEDLCGTFPEQLYDEESHTELFDKQWDQRFSVFDQSWTWAQVGSWIHDFLQGEDFELLSQKTQQIEDDLRYYIAEIAALKAWTFCFSRLEDDHRSSMEAWLQAMNRFGKGTGRHAMRHRRDALNHLQHCKEVIPAWVMPLHRVWDTVDADAELFDCVIVDEASQCGLESLPLLYLGKKVLVVGDDKQISPEAIGLDQGTVQPWAWEYLRELQFGSTFDVRSSLFDHGRVRFGKHKITLREHFRCMPEIIKFSNDLCYSDTPLIPLRQYSPDRLVPVMHQFVNDGYRSGSGGNAINIPEAEAVVDRIVQICQDRRYDSKSIGVISLQGQKQAAEIERMLLDKVGPEEIKRRRLICGSAYSFQGDERDVMLLSMVAAANERIGTLTRLSDERRFNVAASRARDQMILFHSVRVDELSTRCLRRRLLEFFQGVQSRNVGGIDSKDLEKIAFRANRQSDSPPRRFESWFEVDVALELIRKGFEVIPQFQVDGRRIDLVVVGHSSRLAVECDGDRWHGRESYDQDMDRQRQLERCGWEFFRVRQSRFYAQKEEVLEELWTALRDRDIVAVEGGNDLRYEAGSGDAETNAVSRDESEQDLNRDDAGSSLGSSRIAVITNSEIRSAVLDAIADCPNRSCTVDSLTTRVLRFLGVVTRGKPRAEFAKRVVQMTKVLQNEGRIESYRSKNERVRLL